MHRVSFIVIFSFLLVSNSQASSPVYSVVDGLVTGEFSGTGQNSTFRTVKQGYAFLQSITELFGAMLLEPAEGLDFTGESLQELTSTTWGLAATGSLGDVMVEGMEELMVHVSQLSPESWQIKIIPKAAIGSLIFIVGYNAHTDKYEFHKQTHQDTLALYTLSAALGLGTKGLSEGLRLFLAEYIGIVPGWTTALADLATTVVVGAGVGIIARHQKRDITEKDLKKLPNYILALALGNAIIHGGSFVSLSVKQLALSEDMPETYASGIGDVSKVGALSFSIGLVTIAGLHEGNGDWKNYAEKALGDMKKCIGLTISTKLIHPMSGKIKQAYSNMDQRLYEFEEHYINTKAARLTRAVRWPLIYIGSHLALAGGALHFTRLSKDWQFHLMFGYWYGVGDGVLQDLRDSFVERTYAEHFSIVMSVLLVQGLYYMTAPKVFLRTKPD